MGEPLAVAVLRARPEVPAGDDREAGAEAAVPAALADRLGARQVGPAGHVDAEAGGAGQGAVAARDAAFGDLGPARRVELRHEPVAEARRLDRVPDRGADAGDRLDGGDRLVESGRADRQPGQQLRAGRRAGLHDEAGGDLGEGEVVAAPHLGAGLHGRTEAGRRGGRALHGHHQRGASAQLVVRLDEGAPEEDAVLDAERRELAGPNAEEGELRDLRLRRPEADLSVDRGSDRERHDRREGEALPARGANDVAEREAVAALDQAVAARPLLVAPTLRQIVDGRDLVVDDRLVRDRGTDQASAILAEEVEQVLEVGPREEERAAHRPARCR